MHTLRSENRHFWVPEMTGLITTCMSWNEFHCRCNY